MRGARCFIRVRGGSGSVIDSDRTRSLPRPVSGLLHRENDPGGGDPERREERDGVADDLRDTDLLVAGAGRVDQPVVGDQYEGREADRHRQLARGPRELVAAEDDHGEDPPGEGGGEHEPAEDREVLKARAAELAVAAEEAVAARGP